METKLVTPELVVQEEVLKTKTKDLSFNTSIPPVRITKINGDSKPYFEKILNNAKKEVVILSRSWKDVIFQPDYQPIFTNFFERNVPIKIIIASRYFGGSPDFISKHISVPEKLKPTARAYFSNEELCSQVFFWRSGYLPEIYPAIVDDAMFHIRAFDSNPKKMNWYSMTSGNDKEYVTRLRQKLNYIFSSPETKLI